MSSSHQSLAYCRGGSTKENLDNPVKFGDYPGCRGGVGVHDNRD